MKNHLLNSILLATILLVAGSFSCHIMAEAVITIHTYTFTDEDWKAKLNEVSGYQWEHTLSGYAFDKDNKGVQITANKNKIWTTITSPQSYQGITNISVVYGSSKEGEGKLKLQIGDNRSLSGTFYNQRTDQSTSATYATPQSGKVKLSFLCTTNSIYIKSISITFIKTHTLTVTDAKYATFCCEDALDFSEVEGIAAYKARLSENNVVLTPFSDGIVPAGVGMIVYAEEAGDYSIPATASEGNNDNNELMGTIETTTVRRTDDVAGNTYYNYIMQSSGDGIVFAPAKTDGALLKANRAYLHTETELTTSRIAMRFATDEETSIGGISVNSGETNRNDDTVRDLMGRRITKGDMKRNTIYIIDGKKVMNK